MVIHFSVRLTYIDFGNAEEVYVRDLRVFPEELVCFPPLAMECRLAGVGPSLIQDLSGCWGKAANEWFEKNALDVELQAKVHSSRALIQYAFLISLLTFSGVLGHPRRSNYTRLACGGGLLGGGFSGPADASPQVCHKD